MLVRPGEYLLGSWALAKTAPTPCFPGHQVEELSLTLPPGRDMALLPRGKTIENPYLLYQSNWQRDGPVVTVRRETTVKLAVAVCRGPDTLRARRSDRGDPWRLSRRDRAEAARSVGGVALPRVRHFAGCRPLRPG